MNTVKTGREVNPIFKPSFEPNKKFYVNLIKTCMCEHSMLRTAVT